MTTGGTRARDLGIPFGGTPGPRNAITDVDGVTVGMVTHAFDDPANGVSARTGVTAILPLGIDGIGVAVPAGIVSLNGNGEMTGSHWIRETGGLAGPVMLTNTHAVGTVHRGVIDWTAAHRPDLAAEWLLPVVAETWDGYLNSINAATISTSDAGAAIDGASSSGALEGSHGGGTGMNCYGYKGGNGTASRVVTFGGCEYVVGAFLQANFGGREELVIAGVSMRDIDAPCPIEHEAWIEGDRSGDFARTSTPGGSGSVIVIVATDAPLLPQQCEALARRVPLGLARTGSTGSHFSGDLFLAFSTGNRGALTSGFPREEEALRSLEFVPWNAMDRLYRAVVEAVEESVVNALVNNEGMIGRNGHASPALPHEQVTDRLRSAGG